MKTQSEDIGKLLLRIAVGGLMLFHGIYKLQHGVGWMTSMLAQNGLPGFISYGVYIGEVIAPIMIIIGWKTRLGALILAFNMLMAIFLAFKDKLFTLKEQGGAISTEIEMFFFLASFAIFCLGAGRYSVSKGIGRWD